jgi:hypothetical protein
MRDELLNIPYSPKWVINGMSLNIAGVPAAGA